MSASNEDEPALLVLGEALVDFIDQGDHRTFVGHPGGSPLNVAIAAARLGCATAFAARLSGDFLGQQLRAHALAHDLDLRWSVPARQPSSLAIVSVNDGGDPMYDFHLDGTADWQWTPADLVAVSSAPALLHVGSIASWRAPGSAVLLDAVRQLGERPGTLISYDPNIRPQLLPDLAAARAIVEEWAALAGIVKASAEDVGWLYPGWPVEDVAAAWIDEGAALVVVTDGAAGSYARSAGGAEARAGAMPVTVADTVGAGDSFTAALCVRVVEEGIRSRDALARLGEGVLREMLTFAGVAAGLSCALPGPTFPSRSEVDRLV